LGIHLLTRASGHRIGVMVETFHRLSFKNWNAPLLKLKQKQALYIHSLDFIELPNGIFLASNFRLAVGCSLHLGDRDYRMVAGEVAGCFSVTEVVRRGSGSLFHVHLIRAMDCHGTGPSCRCDREKRSRSHGTIGERRFLGLGPSRP